MATARAAARVGRSPARVSTRIRRTTPRQGPRAPMNLVERMQVRAGLLVTAFVDRLMRLLAPVLAAEFGQRTDAVDLDELFAAVQDGQLGTEFLKQMFRMVDAQAASDLDAVVPGVSMQQVLPNARKLEQEWVQQNTDLIKVEERARQEVAKIIHETSASARVEVVREKIQERLGVVRSRAELIARDQTLKVYAALQQERQENAGITEYVWSTSEDERVRPDHADLDGTVHRWDSPPIVDKRTGRRGHPGTDYQCRCAAVPVLSD